MPSRDATAGAQAPSRASYRDVLDAPPNMVAEIVGECSAPTHGPHRCTRSRVQGLVQVWVLRSATAAVGQAVGGSSTSPNSTLGTMSWCPTWPVGGGNECRRHPNPHGSQSRRTGSARSFHPPPAPLTRAPSGRSTLASGFPGCGSWTRTRARWRRSSLEAAIGCCSTRLPATLQFRYRRSRPSRSTSVTYGGRLRTFSEPVLRAYGRLSSNGQRALHSAKVRLDPVEAQYALEFVCTETKTD